MAAPIILPLLAMGAILVAEAPRPDAISVQGKSAPQYIANDKGTTLYVFDGDLAGRECVDECAQAWPLLAASADAKPVGDWKPVIAAGGGGKYQWAYKNRRVYMFRGDSKPGEASGDGVGAAWHALEYAGKPPQIVMPASVAIGRVNGGFVLTDASGRTLYRLSKNGQKPLCKDECLESWPPLRAPALASAVGDWRPVDRPDGLRQWAYRDQLAYMFSDDIAPGDAKGARAGSPWTMLTAQSDSKSEAKPVKTAARGKEEAANMQGER